MHADAAMDEPRYLLDVLVILLAAIVAAGLFQRLKVSPVLGYLVAGTVIGPYGLGLVGESETIAVLADLGVVFLLFSVGLELPLERLKTLRRPMAGLGTAQILVTGIVIGVVLWLAGFAPPAAFVVGAALSLSSTALVLRLMSARGIVSSRFGRSAIAVLLAQDLAVGILLVLIAVLGRGGEDMAAALAIAVGKIALAIVLLIGVGRIGLRALYRPIAAIGSPEIFTAFTLFVVIGVGLMSEAAGLTMGFGAFLAGMLMAETHYRHQVAADILPFRVLLLGLFFMAVGMSVDIRLAQANWIVVAVLSLALLTLKASILVVLGGLFRMTLAESLRLGLLLAQSGEFAFVLLGAGVVAGLVAGETGQILTLVVAVTMMLTPLLAAAGRHLQAFIERRAAPPADLGDQTTEALRDHVIIAGFGRVGRSLASSLAESDIPFVAVDLNAHEVDQARARGLPVFFGDATRPEVMEALRAEEARAAAVCVDDPVAATRLVALLHYIFPNLRILARARDEAHAAELRAAGALDVAIELLPTGRQLAEEIFERRGEDA